MKTAVVLVAIFFLLIGVWYALALVISGQALFRLSALLGTSVALFCVGGVYSGVQILRRREAGRLVASLLCIWELAFTPWSASHPGTSRVDPTSVVVILFLAASLLIFLQLPGVRRQFQKQELRERGTGSAQG